MISNQILQDTIEGIKNITRTELCVMDTEGKNLASTFRETDDYEDLDEEDMYDEITPKTLEEKKLYYDKHNIFKETLWDKKVTCIHCDKTFMFNDFKVVREKPEYCEDENE